MKDGLKLELAPIGYIHTEMVNKFDAPHQPDNSLGASSVIKLIPKQDFHKSLEDLNGFDYVWLVWWFHKNSTWRPKVRPPRGEGVKRGLFATRSPHRPNPIGISAVKLISVDHLEIRIGDCDLIDGTPILDVKPYVPSIDSFPDARIGWLEEVENFYLQDPKFEIKFTETAIMQREWLKKNGVNFLDRAVKILERDPSVNRTRRITKFNDGFRMGCAEWRIFFSVDGREVVINYFAPGYPKEKLVGAGSEVIVNRDIQLQFYSEF